MRLFNKYLFLSTKLSETWFVHVPCYWTSAIFHFYHAYRKIWVLYLFFFCSGKHGGLSPDFGNWRVSYLIRYIPYRIPRSLSLAFEGSIFYSKYPLYLKNCFSQNVFCSCLLQPPSLLKIKDWQTTLVLSKWCQSFSVSPCWSSLFLVLLISCTFNAVLLILIRFDFLILPCVIYLYP